MNTWLSLKERKGNLQIPEGNDSEYGYFRSGYWPQVFGLGLWYLHSNREMNRKINGPCKKKKKKWPIDYLIKWDVSRGTYNQRKQQISLPSGLGIGRQRKKSSALNQKLWTYNTSLFRGMEPELTIPVFCRESPSVSVSIGWVMLQ